METKNRRDYTEVISDSRCPVSAILSLSRVSRDVRRTAFSQKEENIYLLTIGGGGGEDFSRFRENREGRSRNASRERGKVKE